MVTVLCALVWFALGPHAARSESNVMQKALNKIQRKLFITILVNKLSGSPSLRVILGNSGGTPFGVNFRVAGVCLPGVFSLSGRRRRRAKREKKVFRGHPEP